MVKRNSKSHNSATLRIGIIFCAFVFFLIAVSLVFKFILLLEKGKYDGKHNFTLIVQKKPLERTINIVTLSPDIQKISVLKVSGNNISSAGKILKVPVDGIIEDNESGEAIEPVLRRAIIGKANTNLTIIDIFRLWLFARTVTEKSVTSRNFSLQEELTDDLIDKVSSQSFLDYSLSTEKVSIQIINGTGISGLGNRLARVITNIGGNVVAVSTSDKLFDSSEILYKDKETYTVERLTEILGFNKTKIKETQISDVIIKIGKDSLPSITF